MSENKSSEQNQSLTGERSPEELEAAQAANEFEAINELATAQAEVATLQAKNTELADNYLRAKAETENARRRADDEVSKARKYALESFAESLLPVADSLEAGLSMGQATPEQQNRLKEEFKTLLVRTYAGALAQVTDQNIVESLSASTMPCRRSFSGWT